ncbi:MAG: hypothetical protein ABIT69_04315 [Sphingomicrobium sp.]
MTMVRRLTIAAALIALSGCGKVGPLVPPNGQSLPVRPMMATHTPDAAELLAYTTQARPERVDELMRRSQPRKADRFDLPPPDAGLAPASPTASTEPAAVTAGPDNVQEPR